jgi:hypothetical protein
MTDKEKNGDDDIDFEIEIVDDTPEADRGRPLAPEVTANDDDITIADSEISRYSDDVKKRIKELSFKTHSERRAKESAAKERDEALRLANMLADENKKYRQLAGSNEQFAVNQAKNRAESDITAAKRSMKEAWEAGETDKFINEQERLQRLVNEHDRYANYQPAALPEPEYNIPQPKPQPDAKVVDWANKNPWFEGGTELEKEMTGYAYAVSDVLIRDSKIDPTSDKYFDELNKRVQRRFSEYFTPSDPEPAVTGRTTEVAPRRQPSTVVAPVTRTAQNTRKVQLTPSQVTLARRFGLTPEQYVAQYLKDYGHG